MKPDGKAWQTNSRLKYLVFFLSGSWGLAQELKKVTGKIIHSHDILGILFPHLIYQRIPYIRVLRRCRSDPLGWVNFDSHFHHFHFIVWVETFKKILQNLFVARYRQLQPVCLHDDSYSEALAWGCWVCESVCVWCGTRRRNSPARTIMEKDMFCGLVEVNGPALSLASFRN